MKRLFYFMLLFAGITAVHSCNDLLDENGDPLLDTNTNTGLNGPRALYREITDSDTLATYYYNGTQVSRVMKKKASVEDISWSGDKISRIDFRGFLDLDLDNDNVIDKDSILFTRQFTYGANGRLEMITEGRSYYKKTIVPPATTPGPQTLYKRTASIYKLVYSATTAKLESINMEGADVVSGTPIMYTRYSNTKFEYNGDNVSKVTRSNGPITSSGQGAAVVKLGYDYANYDAQINPYTLLPFAYRVSRILSIDIADGTDWNSWMMSPNSPKRKSVTDLTVPVPNPVVQTTDLAYDPQTYVTKGYGINYIYKPL